MNTIQSLLETPTDSAFSRTLDRADIERNTPAALAAVADPRTSPTYTFLSTERVIGALRDTGFFPVKSAQVRARGDHRMSARHAIRFRRSYETVSLRDCIPEILFINGHDGRTATQFRLALYRPICTNGLIVCNDTLPVWRVPHRGNILEEVIAAALAQAAQMELAGAYVERMQQTALHEAQRLAFATDALALRFPKSRPLGLMPEHLLQPRRAEDLGHDLWTTYNVVQEAVIKGGLEYQTARHRRVRSRGIRAIRQDVLLNEALWSKAVALLP